MKEHEPRLIRIAEDRWTTLRHIVEAIALVTAGAWAFYTFVYQEKIKPAGEPASLDASISVHRLGRDRRRDILGINILLRNSGRTEIDIAADAYNVWGDRFAGRRSVSRHAGIGSSEYDVALARTSRQLIARFYELRDAAVGGRQGAHIILEPDSSELLHYVVVVPTGAFDLIHAQTIAVPVKTSVRQKTRVSVTRGPDDGFVLTVTGGADAFEDDNSTDFALVP